MKITVVWSMWHDLDYLVNELRLMGRQPVSSVTITLDTPDCFIPDDLAICEGIFEETNLYSGNTFWPLLEPVLPEHRSHTALSVGDYVVVEDRSYRCDSVGWTRAERPADTSEPALTP